MSGTHARDVRGLTETNRERSRTASARDAAAARALLDEGTFQPSHRRLLQARVDHPEASLSQLGDLVGVSKDSAAAMLRRALGAARD